ncbi:MAG: hypothetical protein ACRDV9_13225 [Acidimicrobiia bacterium]
MPSTTCSARLRARHRLWRWSDVAEWGMEMKPEAVEDARVIAAFNVMLETRRLDRQLNPSALQLIVQTFHTQAG